MQSIPSKIPLFVFEALGSLACGFYGHYVFFLLRDHHGFNDLGNLGAAALMGFVIALASWQSGKLAQRRGCFGTMQIGLCGMIAALTTGVFFQALPVQLVVMIVWAASQFMIWPALEAMITDGVSGPARARLVGIYSIVWATCAALAYFFGGAIFERLGSDSVFWLPTVIHILQIVILTVYARPSSHFFESHKERPSPIVIDSGYKFTHSVTWAAHPSCTILSPRIFQRMAWIANPFACVAAFTLLAMIPGLATRISLTTTTAGLFGSIWLFARLFAFVLMWQWLGWQYRLRWLLGGYLLLIVGFACVLTAGSIPLLALGQIVFGFAVGILYYASLFYSMDVGEARAEQGGIHEAMMGAGNFVGPGTAAISIILVPQSTNAAVWSVSIILALGLLLLIHQISKLKKSNST